eukprot:176475-Chlamydomonas_euryale.AAC.5
MTPHRAPWQGMLSKICRDTSKMATEQMKGLSSQVIKSLLFNGRPAGACAPAPPPPAAMEL